MVDYKIAFKIKSTYEIQVFKNLGIIYVLAKINAKNQKLCFDEDL